MTSVKSKKFLLGSFSVAKFGIAPKIWLVAYPYTLEEKNNWTTFTTFLHPFAPCLYLLLNDHHAPPGCLHCTTYRSPWAWGCYRTSKMILWWQLFLNILQHVNHSFGLLWFPFFVRQCLLRFTDVIWCLLFAVMMDLWMMMLVVCNFTVIVFIREPVKNVLADFAR